MSLLLDALKKAAQEKQNADSADRPAEADGGLSLQPVTDTPPAVSEDRQSDDRQIETPTLLALELELDDDPDPEPAAPGAELTPGDETPGPPDQPSPFADEHRMAPTPSTVSDEALQLLIHKTNQEYRKTRVIVWGGVVVGALSLLCISGFYFYSNMMDEIDSMHRKHQITLATLESKTRLEENLTSLAKSPEDDTAKTDARDRAAETAAPTGRAARNRTGPEVRRQNEQTFSVKRTDKLDPVSAALQSAWTAYQNRDYTTSMREYREVLAKEPENHDALLGVAAVSLQNGDSETARDIYIKLLEKDPRDPHAHAGLANIAQSGGASLSETRLKQLIEYRPDDAHLQFALGNLYVQQQSWPEAQQAFFNAWTADSGNADYAYNLAVSLDQLGKHREAKIFYENSLELAPGKNVSFSEDAVRSRLAYLGTLQ